MDPLILIAVIAAVILFVLYVTGRVQIGRKRQERPSYMWRPVPTPDCLYPTPQGLCKQPYHLEV